MIRLTVTNNLEATIMRQVNDMKFSEPLKQSIDLLKSETIENIRGQGFKYGTFKPLKPATIKSRGNARPILIRSGRGVRSFETKVVGDSKAELTNSTDYMGYHQTGTRKGLPIRTIYGYTENTLRAIAQVFVNYINKKLSNTRSL